MTADLIEFGLAPGRQAVAPIEIRQRFYRPGLTGVRGLAALWVAVFHFYEVAERPFALPLRDRVFAVRSGYLGVDLFFVLSGFVLTLNYCSRLQRLEGAAVWNFVRTRFLRILPLQWTSLLLLLLLSAVIRGGYWGPGPFSPAAFGASMLLVQAWIGIPLAWNSSAWSLSAEWLAYLLFLTFVSPLARVTRRSILSMLLILALLPLYMLVYLRTPVTFDHAERVGLVRCVCEFSAGAVLCRISAGSYVTHRTSNALLVGAGALLLAALTSPLFDGLAPVAFALVIISCTFSSPWAERLLGNRPIVFLGEISFSLYLIHEILFRAAINVAHADQGSERTLLGLAAIMLVPLAWLSWRWIELPGQLLGKCRSPSSIR